MDEDKETGWVSIVSYDGNGGDLETYLDMPLAIWRRIEQGEDISKGQAPMKGSLSPLPGTSKTGS